MPISFDKRNKRWRYYFDRVIDGKRSRASKLLPKGWSKSEADAYDRSETGQTYAVATGVVRIQRTIDDAVKVYLEDKPHLKNLHNLKIQLLACIDWYEGRPIAALPEVAKAYQRDNPSLAPATIRNRLAYLRAACRHAWKHHDYCDQDPAGKLVMPTVNNERHVYLSRREMVEICRLTKNKSVRAAIRIAFYSGMREDEICKAEAGDFFVLGDTKNGTPRVVPIHPRLNVIIRSRHWPMPVTKWTISKGFKHAAIEAGYGHAVFHDLRHSAASEMINSQIDLYTVGAVLGHKSQKSTARYSHLATHTLAHAVGKIGKRQSPA
jgi:integrase